MTTHQQTCSDIYPCLTYHDAANAIDWLCRAFGFNKRFIVYGEDNHIEHSELTIGTGVIMVSSPKAEDKRVSPKNLAGHAHVLSVYVDNPEAHYKNAITAGAKIIRELCTEDYGATGYMASDPEGHLWYFGDYRPGEFWEKQ